MMLTHRVHYMVEVSSFISSAIMESWIGNAFAVTILKNAQTRDFTIWYHAHKTLGLVLTTMMMNQAACFWAWFTLHAVQMTNKPSYNQGLTTAGRQQQWECYKQQIAFNNHLAQQMPEAKCQKALKYEVQLCVTVLQHCLFYGSFSWICSRLTHDDTSNPLLWVSHFNENCNHCQNTSVCRPVWNLIPQNFSPCNDCSLTI